MNEQTMTNTYTQRIIILQYLLATFLLSGFLFSFEFLLTRIWFHLAVAIAMYYGFTFSLLFGATAYFLLIFSLDYKH
jgi:hypothetical protein